MAACARRHRLRFIGAVTLAQELGAAAGVNDGPKWTPL